VRASSASPTSGPPQHRHPPSCVARNLADRQSDGMDDTGHDVLAGVGPRLRDLRRRRGATLDRLAAETALTASTLSRLETGKLRPTLEQLLPLARAHGVPLDDLVQAPPTGDPRIHLRPVRHRGLVFVPLTRRGGGVQAFKVVYPPATASPTTALQTHEGYEWFLRPRRPGAADPRRHRASPRPRRGGRVRHRHTALDRQRRRPARRDARVVQPPGRARPTSAGARPAPDATAEAAAATAVRTRPARGRVAPRRRGRRAAGAAQAGAGPGSTVMAATGHRSAGGADRREALLVERRPGGPGPDPHELDVVRRDRQAQARGDAAR
jgi:transcriptional regulator with XRE-family HTH domain